MPRAEQLKPYTSFIKGLITEAGPLTFPENASFDEDNMVLSRTGKRSRRLGLDYETGYALSTQTFSELSLVDSAITTKTWNAVAGQGSRNFLVIQIGTTLYFHNYSSILSQDQKSFTVDLSTYAISGASNQAADKVSMSSGRGKLYVVGKQQEPIAIEYDPDLDSITVTEITLQIRDFEGTDDSLGNSEEPATLSAEHEYNLRNQGWNSPGNGEPEPITTYFSSEAVYPPNSKQWWVAKNSSEVFDASLLTKFSQGEMLAPRGHYVLDAFNKDRDTAAGVSGITTETESTRPVVTAFYAGRVWYAGLESSKQNGSVFYSQVVEGDDNIGRCYQDADPTSEDVSDLVDTDGGVVQIPRIGNVKALFETEDKLMVMADNGVWSIAGTEGSGFKATDFAVTFVGSVGVLASESVVDVEGVPIWWADTGIYTVQADQISGRLKPQNLTSTTIQTYYNEVPAKNKSECKGIYDSSERRVRWYYTENGEDAPTKYTKTLTLDVDLGAFYPWSISSLETNSPWIGSVFTAPVLSDVSGDAQVITLSGDTVLDSSSDNVIISQDEVQTFSTFTWTLVFETDGTDTQYTFAFYNNGEYVDWESADSEGVDAPAFLDTGYELGGDIARFKQSNYLFCYFEKVNDGGCFVKAKWDWHDNPNLGKHSTKFEAYREKQATHQGPVVVSRSKVRGKGRALQLRFESQPGKDLELLGWANNFSGNTKV